MNKEKGRVPKLRFPGFTEDWEQRKLGDIATFSKGNGYSKSDLASSGDPIILYGRLYTNYETTISNVDTFVELKDKSVISQGGEVIVPASGETAEDISRASVVKKQGIIIGGDLNVIKANHLLDPTFLALTISNGEQQKELSKRAQGKSVVHLHNSDLQEVNLTFPLLNEQKEISTLFEKMDNIITLHQRKLEHLNLKKKALLQKLFPKNGARYPELRFPGFTDAWEQRKLGSIGSTYTGLSGKTKEDFGHGEAQYITYLNVFQNTVSDITMTDKVEIDTTQNEVKYGDVLFTTSSETPEEVGMSSVWLGYMPNIYLNSFCFGFRPNQKIDPYFLGYSLRAPYMRDKIKILAQGISRYNISKNKVMELEISLPNNEEQRLLGNFLRNIDLSITLHQRKLGHLQLQKKALLQQMFV